MQTHSKNLFLFNPLILIIENISLESVIVSNSKFGKGIFTPTDLSKNTILFKIIGKPITFSKTLQLEDKVRYCLQIGMNKYIIPDFPFPLSNHSCEPNCGINNNLEFIALQNIKP